MTGYEALVKRCARKISGGSVFTLDERLGMSIAILAEVRLTLKRITPEMKDAMAHDGGDVDYLAMLGASALTPGERS